MTYRALIIDATGASPEDAAQIEDIMRKDIFHSTLDWQTSVQLRKAAKEGAEILRELKEAGLV